MENISGISMEKICRNIKDSRTICKNTATVSHQTIIQIYVDWANHYLQKGRNSKTKIQDLQEDLKDGVIISDVVQSITNQKVPGVTRKPKNAAQMLENLENILIFVGTLGISIDGISANELRDGQLRPILRLFFELSKYKQKDLQPMPPKKEKTSGIPVAGTHSSIPSIKKSSNHVNVLHTGNISGSSSRSESPLTAASSHLQQTSFIPMPKTSHTGNNNGINYIHPSKTSHPEPGVSNSSTTQEKNSMLQKFRMFKEKKGTSVNGSKRTSSSSGFSSAKSDSSVSNDSKPESTNIQHPTTQVSANNQSEIFMRKKQDKKSGAVSSESLPTTNGHQSTNFLRNSTRPLSSTGKDSRLRYSVSGIPTRPINNVNTSQQLTSISSIPQQQLTLIPQPKPIAAIKGLTKSTIGNNSSPRFPEKTSNHNPKKKSLRNDPTSELITSTNNSITNSSTPNKQELKAIVAPLPTGIQQSSKKEENVADLKNDHELKNKNTSPAAIYDELEEDEILKNVIPMEPIDRKSSYTPLRSPPFISPPPILANQCETFSSFQSKELLFSGYISDGATKTNPKHEPSVEETSSLSSGISDILEISPDSLLSSPYASLRRLKKEDINLQQKNLVEETPLLDESDSSINRIMTGIRHTRDFQELAQSSGKGDDWSKRSNQSLGYMHSGSQLTNGYPTHNKGQLIPSSPLLSSSRHQHDESKLANHVSLSQRPPPHLISSSKNRARTRVKVSGGTQTTNDLNISSSTDFMNLHSGKSLSLTSPNAQQLADSLRQRMLMGTNSLPKDVSSDYVAILNSIQQQEHYFQQHHRTYQQAAAQHENRVSREKRLTRDSPYAVYAEIKEAYSEQSPNRYSSPYSHSSIQSPASTRHDLSSGRNLTEGESLESLNSSSSVNNRDLRGKIHGTRYYDQQQREPSPSGINRSSSISHFCERTFPRSTKSEKIYPSLLQRGEDPSSNSNTPKIVGESPQNFNSSTRFSNCSGTPSNNQPLRLSMSPYASFSKQPKDDEITGSTLSLLSQASSIYSTTEEKQAHELRKLKRELKENQEKIHTLNNQLSTNAHVVAAFEQSLANMTQRLQTLTLNSEQKESELIELRQTIELLKKQGIEAGLVLPRVLSPNSKNGSNGIGRQLSADSVSSINSISSATSSHSHASSATNPVLIGQHQQQQANIRPRPKGWLRSSFSKAFSRSKGGKIKDDEGILEKDSSANNVDALSKEDPSTTIIIQNEQKEKSADELRKQLREKEMILTDIRLEALTSAHQLESLKEAMTKMRNEMASLRQENDRLQRILSAQCPGYSIHEEPKIVEGCIELGLDTSMVGQQHGKNVHVFVSWDDHESFPEMYLGKLNVSNKAKWEQLDTLVRRVFKEYTSRIDPSQRLGLSSDSIKSYSIGEIERKKNSDMPELLPCGFIVGDVNKIIIHLNDAKDSSVDLLAFQILIEKQTVHRWINCLLDYHHLLLSGVHGVGKSFLAHRLAEWIVNRHGKNPSPEAIYTLSMDGRGAQEGEDYLLQLSKEWTTTDDFPYILIIENIQEKLQSNFYGNFERLRNKPYVIATTTIPVSDPQGIGIVELCPTRAPLKGFVGRFLERRLIEAESNGNSDDLAKLGKIFRWIPQVFSKVNEELENCENLPIGPRLFLSCPIDSNNAESWFTNLWNTTLRLHLREIIAHSNQIEIFNFITKTFPWNSPDKILQ